MNFEAFPKIGRLKRDCVVTEKIDGSNAQVAIVPIDSDNNLGTTQAVSILDGFAIYAGSRNRWLQPGKTTDNFGFAGWVRDNATELAKLGEGRHYGEWWGLGIQRGYDMTERRFSLFNTHRWRDERPACCHVVPVLYQGLFDGGEIEHAVSKLRFGGSIARPDFMQPEGIIIYHAATKTMFKRTLEDDDAPKSLVAA